MVVNELTSCVQAKGTKTVIATAVAALVAGGAMAANTVHPSSAFGWDGESLLSAEKTAEGVTANVVDGVIQINAKNYKSEGTAYGVFTNLYRTTEDVNSDRLSSTGVKIGASNFEGNTSANAGGALTLWQDGSKDGVVLHHEVGSSTFKNNTANLGGAVALLSVNAYDNKEGSTTFSGSTFEGNSASYGGAIYAEGTNVISKNDRFVKNKTTGRGGSIYLTQGSTLFVENASFEENEAARGAAIANDNASPLIVKNSQFVKNKATDLGGALYHGDGIFEIYDSSFVENSAALHGGAIASVFDVKNTVKIDGSEFLRNSAYLGGAMAIYYGLSLSNSTFEGNFTTANDDGGGAIVLGGHAKVDINGTTFKNNKANIGGAISTRPAYYLDFGDSSIKPNDPKTGDGHWLHIANSHFEGNAAVVESSLNNKIPYDDYGMYNGNGGAVANGFMGSVIKDVVYTNYIEDSTFESNEASYGGGAIYNQGVLTVRGSATFKGNKAQYGGAVFTDANELTFEATDAADVISFIDNSATQAGSDLYLGEHSRVQSDKSHYSAAVVNLTGKGNILFNGSIGGVASSTINSAAANVKIADAKNFAGTFNQTNGQTTVAGDKYFGGDVNVQGGKLVVEGDWSATSKTKLSSGTLATDGKNIFVQGEDKTWAVTEAWTSLAEKNGVLELTNTGFDYTLEELKAAQALLNQDDSKLVQLSLKGNLVVSEDDDLTSGSLDGYIAPDVTVDATETGTATFTKDTTVGAIDFGENETASIAGDGTVTLAGNGEDVFVLSDKVDTVSAKQLELGKDQNASGNVNVQTLTAENLTVTGDFTAKDVKATTGVINGTLTADTLTGATDMQVRGTLALNGKTAETGEAAAEIGGTITVNGDTAGIGVLTTNRAAAAQYLGNLDAEEEVKNIVYVDRTIVFEDGAKVNIGAVPTTFALLAAGDTPAAAPGKLTLAAGNQVVVDASAFADTKNVVFANAEVDATQGEVYFVNVNKTGEMQVADKLAGSVDTDSLYIGVDLVDNGDKGLVKFGYNQGLLADKTVDGRLEALFAKGASAKEMAILDALAKPEFVDYDEASDTATFNELGNKAFKQAASGNATAGVLNVAYDANAQVTDAIVRHQLSEHAGMGVWADVFYAKNEAKELYGDFGYSADIYGGVLGFDYTAACGGTLGAALTVGTADADSEGGALSNSLSSDFVGLSVYASKDFSGLNVKADLGYIDFSNDFSGLGDASDASTITFGVRGDFTAYQNGAFSIAPHFGLRYTRIDTDAVAFNDEQNMNVFEAPIGVKFAGTFEATGWKVVPSYDFTIVPQLGDKDVEAFGTAGDITILSGGLFNNVLGVEAVNGNLSFGLNASYGFGPDDRANTQVNANVRYNF